MIDLSSKKSRIILAVVLITVVSGTGYKYEQQQQLQDQLQREQHQQRLLSNATLCQATVMRAYQEPGYHLENGTFVFSKDYDTIIVWTLINCNETVGTNFVGIFKLLPNGFNRSIEAYYNPQAFTVYTGEATYEQRILLYLPSLGNETRNLTLRLIILAYTNNSVIVGGIASGNITV